VGQATFATKNHTGFDPVYSIIHVGKNYTFLPIPGKKHHNTAISLVDTNFAVFTMSWTGPAPCPAAVGFIFISFQSLSVQGSQRE
jgi:hypothetical protein